MTPITLPATTRWRKTHQHPTADRPQRQRRRRPLLSTSTRDEQASTITTILVTGTTMTVESATIHPIRRIRDPDNPLGGQPMTQPPDPNDAPDIAVEAGEVPK